MPQNPDAIRRVWTQRVAARFHDGMPVATLVATLRAQGFVIWAENHGRGAALVVQKKGHCWENCRVHWDVDWRRDGTRAVEILADYGDVGVPFDEYFESD